MNHEIINANLIDNLQDAEYQLRIHVNNYRQEQIYIWQIFAVIRDNKLWEQSSHSSFIEYCSNVWGYKRSQAYNLASAGETIQFLLKASTEAESLVMPSSVEQAAALSRIPEPERLSAWVEYQVKGTPLPNKRITKKHEKNTVISENSGDPEKLQRINDCERADGDIQLISPPIHEKAREISTNKSFNFSKNLANLKSSEIPFNTDNIDELIVWMLRSFTIQQICKSLSKNMADADLQKISGILAGSKDK